jgi:hypothetical protein
MNTAMAREVEESAGRWWWEAEAKRQQGWIRKEEEKNAYFLGEKKISRKNLSRKKGRRRTHLCRGTSVGLLPNAESAAAGGPDSGSQCCLFCDVDKVAIIGMKFSQNWLETEYES